MDGLRDALYTLRVLAQCNRLTKHEREAVKYALVLLEDIEQTFYHEKS